MQTNQTASKSTKECSASAALGMLATLCLMLVLLGSTGLASDKPAAAAKTQAALDAKIAESTRRAQLKCPEAFETGTPQQSAFWDFAYHYDMTKPNWRKQSDWPEQMIDLVLTYRPRPEWHDARMAAQYRNDPTHSPEIEAVRNRYAAEIQPDIINNGQGVNSPGIQAMLDAEIAAGNKQYSQPNIAPTKPVAAAPMEQAAHAQEAKTLEANRQMEMRQRAEQEAARLSAEKEQSRVEEEQAQVAKRIQVEENRQRLARESQASEWYIAPLLIGIGLFIGIVAVFMLWFKRCALWWKQSGLISGISSAVSCMDAANKADPNESPTVEGAAASDAPLALRDLTPLAFCILALGWTSLCLLPPRQLHSAWVVPLGLIAIPAVYLAVMAMFNFLRPRRLSTTNAFGSFLFTMIAGLALLFGFQAIAGFVADSPVSFRGKASLWYIALQFVGWSYNNVFAHTDFWSNLEGFIFAVGPCEEFTKLLPLFFIVLGNKAVPLARRISYRSFLVIGFFSGLGFGVGEALYQYSPRGGLFDVAANILRWFACVPSHGVWTTIAAACLWMLAPQIQTAKNDRQVFLLCSLTVVGAALAHGLYDAACVWLPAAIFMAGASLLLLYKTVSIIEVWSNPLAASEELAGVDETPNWLMSRALAYQRSNILFKRAYVVCAALILTVTFGASDSSEPPRTNSAHQTSPDEVTVQAAYDRGYPQGAGSGYTARQQGEPRYIPSDLERAVNMVAQSEIFGPPFYGRLFTSDEREAYIHGYHRGYDAGWSNQ